MGRFDAVSWRFLPFSVPEMSRRWGETLPCCIGQRFCQWNLAKVNECFNERLPYRWLSKLEGTIWILKNHYSQHSNIQNTGATCIISQIDMWCIIFLDIVVYDCEIFVCMRYAFCQKIQQWDNWLPYNFVVIRIRMRVIHHICSSCSDSF